MKRARLFRLADWLEREALRELGTAEALAKIEHGDPDPCLIKARLFHEIADILRAEACAQADESSPEVSATRYEKRRGS